MRKLLLAALAVVLSAGFSLAGEVMFVSFDKTKKEVKVKDGKEEKTYKLTDKTKFKSGDKDVKADEAMAMLEKMKADDKLEVTGDKGDATEVKFHAAKKEK
jgi:hypothetical protein